MNIDTMIERWQEEFEFCEEQEMNNIEKKEYIIAHNHAVRKEQIRLFIKDLHLQQVKNNFVLADVISWVAVLERMPEYDGTYLCFVRHQQECGNVWEYQKVVECLINIWIVQDGEQVTHWKQLPEPPCL